MRTLPSVTIVVLNWNGRSYLETCLGALLDQSFEPERIVLVDNSSTDDSVALVKRLFPTVDIVENAGNWGYARGNNAALRNLKTELAILVNPDIKASRDWLENLVAVFAEDETIGIAGCKLLFPGGQQLQHGGGLISHPRAMPEHRGMYSVDQGSVDLPADVDFVTGAAIAASKEMIEKAGLLDEGFFMYFEDVDWCTRALRNGFRVVYVPEATAVHDESAIAVRGSPSYLRRFHSGRWRYLLKHFDGREIVEETVPAEASWLEGITGEERRALGWAYRDTVSDFTAIMAARVAHGAPEILGSDQALIVDGLLKMRQAAMLWAADAAMWDGLAQAGELEPQPFSSTTPLLGPLIERLRELWASVAAKPYTSVFTEQQNDFNQSFVTELEAIEGRLRDLQTEWIRREGDQQELREEMRAMQAELDEANSLLIKLEGRLAARKKSGRS